MKKLKFLTSGLTFRMVAGVTLLFFIFNCMTGTIGYVVFTRFFTRDYNDFAFRTAQTALLLVDGDRIEEYLATGGSGNDYKSSLKRMDDLCQSQNVNLIYVISVDTADYGRFRSVYNVVNANDGFTPWQVGYQRDTTNEEYRQIYKDIYENGLQMGTVVRTKKLNGNMAHITSLVPVHASNGDVTAILCVQRPMSELTTSRNTYLMFTGLSTLGLTVLAAFSLAAYLRRQFVRPTQQIIAEAQRFADENTLTDMSLTKQISKVGEIQALALAIKKLETDTVRYMDNLAAVTAQQERLATELALAKRIQTNVLPKLFPPFPDRGEFDIFASMTPAKEVGGDFYDFFLLDDDHLGLVMADVSGKGVPAALCMMATKNLIKTYAMINNDPQEVLTCVNRQICSDNPSDMFVTVWFGILTISTGKVSAANAGHEYPVIKRRNGSFELFKDKHNFVIGGMPEAKYESYVLELDAGDSLFLYTDGVPEATDRNNGMFGTERLLNALNADSDDGAKAVLGRVSGALGDFVGAADQFDDITMLSVRINARTKNDGITVCPQPSSVLLLMQFLSQRLEQLEITGKAAKKILIAAEEIFTNIVKYSKASIASLTLERADGELAMRFEDDGVFYDPTAVEEPDITLSAQEREIGGLGILMVKKLMDSVTYERAEGKNILRIIKGI